ncbi:MAG: nucleotidyltransferase family protein [Alkalilacustris sp.]
MRGADKLLEPVAGRPLLALLSQRARAAGCAVLVTLPPGDRARRAALAGCDVRMAIVPEAAEGMAASLRAGAAAAEGMAGLLVLPGDMPEIEAADIAALRTAFLATPEPRPILRATSADGRPGHPVILPARLLPALRRLRGDAGARTVLQAHPSQVRAFSLPGSRACTDLDTPEAWAAWRAAHPQD